MSALFIMIAKADCFPKLQNPYIIFDLEWDTKSISSKFLKEIRDLKSIKSDISSHLSGKNSNGDSTLQKDNKDEDITKVIYQSSFISEKSNTPEFVLYYWWLVDNSVNQSKIPNVLKDLHRMLKDNYDPDLFDNKTSIVKDFTDAWYHILDNYNLKPFDKKKNTGGEVINYTKVNKANEKVGELKEQLINNIEGMARNIESGEELKKKSDNLK